MLYADCVGMPGTDQAIAVGSLGTAGWEEGKDPETQDHTIRMWDVKLKE